MLEQLTAANILNFRDVFRFSIINKLQNYLCEKISDLFVNNPVYTLMFMNAKIISIYWLLVIVLSDQVQIYWWERTLIYHKKTDFSGICYGQVPWNDYIGMISINIFVWWCLPRIHR